LASPLLVRDGSTSKKSKHTRPRSLRLESLEDRALMTLAGNQLFPDDSPWNQRVDGAPVAANSATLVNNIGASAPLHPDFGMV
jgi:hypothetical protein